MRGNGYPGPQLRELHKLLVRSSSIELTKAFSQSVISIKTCEQVPTSNPHETIGKLLQLQVNATGTIDF